MSDNVWSKSHKDGVANSQPFEPSLKNIYFYLFIYLSIRSSLIYLFNSLDICMKHICVILLLLPKTCSNTHAWTIACVPDGDWSTSGWVNFCRVSPNVGCLPGWQMSKPSFVWKKADVFKINANDDDDDLNESTIIFHLYQNICCTNSLCCHNLNTYISL